MYNSIGLYHLSISLGLSIFFKYKLIKIINYPMFLYSTFDLQVSGYPIYRPLNKVHLFDL